MESARSRSLIEIGVISGTSTAETVGHTKAGLVRWPTLEQMEDLAKSKNVIPCL